MKIHEIKNLDCSKKLNRKTLIKETMKALGLTEMPNEIYLRKACIKLSTQHHLPIKSIVNYPTFFEVNIDVGNGYSTLVCNSYYEALCKYILFIKAQVKHNLEVEDYDGTVEG